MPDNALDNKIAEATEVFEKDVGVWAVEMEIRPAPGVPPIRLKAVSTNRRIGGGWDPSTGKYTGAWVDSTQTSITRSEGTWDAAARTMTFVTTGTHGDKPIVYREVTESMADGTRVYRNMIPMPNGGEFEMIRAVYRRKS